MLIPWSAAGAGILPDNCLPLTIDIHSLSESVDFSALGRDQDLLAR